MGRLIDKDDVISLLTNHHFDNDKEIFDLLIHNLCKEVKCIPTVYDVDKVVKQMEERTEFLEDCSKYGNQSKEQQRRSYETMMMYEVADLVGDLIDIVKGEAN